MEIADNEGPWPFYFDVQHPTIPPTKPAFKITAFVERFRQHIDQHTALKLKPTPKCLLGISGMFALLPSAAGIRLNDLALEDLRVAGRRRGLFCFVHAANSGRESSAPDVPWEQECNHRPENVEGGYAMTMSVSSSLSEYNAETSMPSPRDSYEE